jgi:AraC-like DNA-binding protein
MILALSLFLLFLAIYLAISNNKVNKTVNYLTGFLLLYVSYSITHHFIVNTKSVFWIAVFYNHLSPFWLMSGPLLYFYIKGTITDKNPLSNSWEYLHFLPSLVQFIGIIPYCLKPFSEKEEIAKYIISNINNIKTIDANWLYPKSLIGFLIRPAAATIYGLYCGIFLINHRPSKQTNKIFRSKQNMFTYYWLVFFVLFFFLLTSSVLVNMYLLTFTENPVEILDKLPSNTLSSISAFIVIICLLTFPSIPYGMPRFREKNKTESSEHSTDPLIDLKDAIILYIHTSQNYLDKDFRVKNLAFALNVPLHHVNYCFKHIIKLPFKDYQILCRINYAKELIEKGISKSSTMEGIGTKSGFSTRASFFKAFKKETNLTPYEYLEKTRKK